MKVYSYSQQMVNSCVINSPSVHGSDMSLTVVLLKSSTDVIVSSHELCKL